MSRLSEAFKAGPILMPYYPLGYPDLETSIDIIEALARNGADLIEVGLSFSDPLADGPVIQKATQIALENGITIKKSLAAVAELRSRGVTIPLVLMGYYNPLLAYGTSRFAADAARAGADGFIIPDLPMEESAEFEDGAGSLPLIRMIAPTTPDGRIQQIAEISRGFVYLVSVAGVTGARSMLPEGLEGLIQKIRRYTETPVCIGFGIGSPEQAQLIARIADGVIVGSACVKAIGESSTPAAAAAEFALTYKKAIVGR